MSSNARRRARLDEIGRWLRLRLADSVQLPPETIRIDVPMTMYGVDSLLGVMMLTEIEDDLGVVVDPDDVPPAMTLQDLAQLVLLAESAEYGEESDVA